MRIHPVLRGGCGFLALSYFNDFAVGCFDFEFVSNLQNYTTLKLAKSTCNKKKRFVPLQNYTTLKPGEAGGEGASRFVPLQNYTTLKRKHHVGH